MASARSLLISIGSGLYAVFKTILVCNRLEEEEKLFALLLLYYRCIVTINVQWLFLAVSWDGLQCVIMRSLYPFMCVILVFPDNTHLLFDVATLVFVLRRYRVKFPLLAYNVFIITIVGICN